MLKCLKCLNHFTWCYQFFPAQFLCPKISLLGGLKYFKLSLLNFPPDANAPVHEKSLLVLLSEFYPGLQEPCSAGGVGTPCTALPCLGLLVSLPGWPTWAELGTAPPQLLWGAVSQPTAVPPPPSIHVSSPHWRGGQPGGLYSPPRSEVCLFTSLCCSGKTAEGPRQGVWGQIWAEWHLPFERSHSPSCLQDLTPCVAAITSQTRLEWWCSVWAEAYAHSFRLGYSVL